MCIKFYSFATFLPIEFHMAEAMSLLQDWTCLLWAVMRTGASCGPGEDGNICPDFWNQSRAGQTLSGESERRPVTKRTARLLPQGEMTSLCYVVVMATASVPLHQ